MTARTMALVRQRRRLEAIAAVTVLLGVTMCVVGTTSVLETRWTVDPLRYEEVAFLPGYPDSTLLVTALDGRVYRLPARLWRARFDGEALAERLREDGTARARVLGGPDTWMFGYPSVEYFETASVRLEAEPAGLLRRMAGLLAGPPLVLIGALAWQRVRRRRAPDLC